MSLAINESDFENLRERVPVLLVLFMASKLSDAQSRAASTCDIQGRALAVPLFRLIMQVAFYYTQMQFRFR